MQVRKQQLELDMEQQTGSKEEKVSVWLLWVRYLSLQPLRELFVMHTTFWLSAYAVMKLFYFLLLVSWVERKLCYLLSSTNNDGDKDG